MGRLLSSARRSRFGRETSHKLKADDYDRGMIGVMGVSRVA